MTITGRLTLTGKLYGIDKRKPYQLDVIPAVNELSDIGTLALKCLGYGYPVLFAPIPEGGTQVIVYCLHDGDFAGIQNQLRIEHAITADERTSDPNPQPASIQPQKDRL